MGPCKFSDAFLSMTDLFQVRCRTVLSIDTIGSGKVHGLLAITKLIWVRSMVVLSIHKMGSGKSPGGFVNDKTWLGPGWTIGGFVHWSCIQFCVPETGLDYLGHCPPHREHITMAEKVVSCMHN